MKHYKNIILCLLILCSIILNIELVNADETDSEIKIKSYVYDYSYESFMNLIENNKEINKMLNKKDKTENSMLYVKQKEANKKEQQQEPKSFPLYNQLEYNHVPYGKYGTVASHGCGITSVAMVATYFFDAPYTPDEMAKRFGEYNTEHGSYWSLFEDSAKQLGLPLKERTEDTEKVLQALLNEQIVVALQSGGIFTDGGHFIILTGITENETIIVNDPYGNNYTKNQEMIDGFEKGFTENQIFSHGGPYWIYDKKTN